MAIIHATPWHWVASIVHGLGYHYLQLTPADRFEATSSSLPALRICRR